MKSLTLIKDGDFSIENLYSGDTIYNGGKSSIVSVHLLLPIENGKKLLANIGIKSGFTIPHDGKYLITNCNCHNASIFIYPENEPYHESKIGGDDLKNIRRFNEDIYEWNPEFSTFNNLLIIIKPCCEIEFSHSATKEPIKILGGDAGINYSVSFSGNIKDLSIKGSKDCLTTMQIIVTRG
jgi:hypothetical protein